MSIPPDRTGDELRDEAFERLRAHRAEIIGRLKAAALAVAMEKGTVTADDVRALVSIPPAIDPRVVGNAFFELTGLLRRRGHKNSERPVAHCRELKQWELAEADRPAAACLLCTLKQQAPPTTPRAGRQPELPFCD